MRKTCRTWLAIAGVALGAHGVIVAPALAQDAAVNAELAETRKALTLDGKPIPPEIFRDMGDGDLADSVAIWVTVDVKAAIGSNLYFDDIVVRDGRVLQRKSNKSPDGAEETGYIYEDATENGLLVVLTTYSGGRFGGGFGLTSRRA